MKIYTKTGDNGETGYIGGRISKGAEMIETLGAVDELNAHLGLINSYLTGSKRQDAKDLAQHVLHIQSTLFGIGTLVANPSKPDPDSHSIRQGIEDATTELETHMDMLDQHLEPLQNFILPGGTIDASHMHIVRAVCRRAEREMVRLISAELVQADTGQTYKDNLAISQKYLNRLSDWLFIASRWLNNIHHTAEHKWPPTT